jgi:hypothetical protein
LSSPEWPRLPYADWEPTLDTLHLWTQIVGKTRLALAPLQNHWWNVPLYVTSRGLSTSSVPCGGGDTFDAEFDFIHHRLTLRASGGAEARMELFPRSVADFYEEYRAALKGLGIEARIWPTPVEFDDLTRFDRDRHHASYDAPSVERFRRVLTNSDRLLKVFQGRFLGKTSPVHFFWGSFDLAVTRFSGRRAPERPGADAVTREAYSHEVISCGFWPGDRRYPNAAYYCYAAPVPPGLDQERLPGLGTWNPALGEFILNYDDVCESSRPEETVREFLESAYEAGARRANWDRGALERDPSESRAASGGA